MDLAKFLYDHYLLEAKFDSYIVEETRGFKAGYKKMLTSGLKKAQKAHIQEQYKIAKAAFENGDEVNLPPSFNNHAWSEDTRTGSYIIGDFHLPAAYVVKWRKYKTIPKVEFFDFDNHPNTGAA